MPPRPILAIFLSLLALLLAGCAEQSQPSNQAAATSPDPAHTNCTLELRSWRVLAQGRHLYLDCDCPEPFAHLNQRIEFTSASLRLDFDRGAASEALAEDPGWSPPIARMTRGAHLAPMVAEPDDRLEQTYTVPASIVADLQADRLFAHTYRLLGPNSNSALRTVLQEAGIPVPTHVLASGGMLGAFPGIEKDPGDPLPPDAWSIGALPGGPTPTPDP